MLLSLACANFSFSVALSEGEYVLDHRSDPSARGHDRIAIGLIDEMLKAHGASTRDLTALAVTVGPGSFTGVRLGIALMRGLELGLQIPLLGVTSFDWMAEAEALQDPHLIVLESMRAELYAKEIGGGNPQPFEIAREDVSALTQKSVVMTTALRDTFDAPLPSFVAIDPDARTLATLAARRLVANELTPAEPFYMRLPDTTGPKA